MGTLVIFAILALWRLSRPEHGTTWQALWWACSRIIIFYVVVFFVSLAFVLAGRLPSPALY